MKGEIRDKTAHNITERKNFETRLKEALNRYHNHNLSVIDIIEELIRISHELNAALLRGEQLGLNDAELAFYDALSQNDSAVELMGNAILKALAQDITRKLRSKVTLD